MKKALIGVLTAGLLIPAAAFALLDCGATECTEARLIQFSGDTSQTMENRVHALQMLVAKLTAKIAAIKASPMDPTNVPGHEAPPCVTLTQQMTVGSTDTTTGGEVSKLQGFLSEISRVPAGSDSIYPERAVTGTFGPATSRAVQKWQAAHGIAITTVGQGVVGPKTRAAMACK